MHQYHQPLPEPHQATCPNGRYLLLDNFFKGKSANLADDVNVEFTQTPDMIRTDNGWLAAS
ncbi:hypothetical protein WI75_03065 [Burkholderia ubonensis]|nr:hypothetical protein WI75_03065 [Burkholderia ubonensis]